MSLARLIGCIAVMAAVTYLVRMLPLAIFKKKITNRYLRSFLAYVPYAVLSAMTFPAVLSSTGSTLSAAAGMAAALVLAFCGRGLLTVALCSAAAVFVTELLMRML